MKLRSQTSSQKSVNLRFSYLKFVPVSVYRTDRHTEITGTSKDDSKKRFCLHFGCFVAASDLTCMHKVVVVLHSMIHRVLHYCICHIIFSVC